MHIQSFRKWIKRVYHTEEDEMDCGAFLKWVPQYVDLEVAGENPDLIFPDAKQHLLQCDECYDLYLTLRDVAEMEEKQAVPELADQR